MRLLRSIKFNAVILALWAALSIVGTIFPERRPGTDVRAGVQKEVNLGRFQGFYNFYQKHRLFEIYHSPLYIGIMVLIGLDVVVCRLNKPPNKFPNAWRVKGPAAWGAYVAHVGLVVLFIGGGISRFFNYDDFLEIAEGSHQTLPKMGLSVHLDRFEVEHYANGVPKDFRSFVKVYEKDRMVAERIIRVNDPLKIKGTKLYQASYAMTDQPRAVTLGLVAGEKPHFFEMEVGQAMPLVKGYSIRLDEFFWDAERLPDGGVALRSGEMSSPAARVSFLQGASVRRSKWFLMQEAREDFKGVSLFLAGATPRYISGLSVGKDPGVWTVWAGCVLLIGGLAAAFYLPRGSKRHEILSRIS